MTTQPTMEDVARASAWKTTGGKLAINQVFRAEKSALAKFKPVFAWAQENGIDRAEVCRVMQELIDERIQSTIKAKPTFQYELGL